MKFTYHLENYLWKAADWVYPPVCAGCGSPGYRYCESCLSQTEPLLFDFCLFCSTSFASTLDNCPVCSKKSRHGMICTSWAGYKEPLRSAIHKLKYDGDQGLGEYFAQKLIVILERRQWKFDLIIPVPLSRKRFRERGYNQSELVSHVLSNYFNVDHSTDSIKRFKETETQFNLNTEERFLNVKDAFSVNPAKLKGRRVLIVDDIITTGATLLQCQEIILAAGAEACYGISIAKAGLIHDKHSFD